MRVEYTIAFFDFLKCEDVVNQHLFTLDSLFYIYCRLIWVGDLPQDLQLSFDVNQFFESF